MQEHHEDESLHEEQRERSRHSEELGVAESAEGLWEIADPLVSACTDEAGEKWRIFWCLGNNFTGKSMRR